VQASTLTSYTVLKGDKDLIYAKCKYFFIPRSITTNATNPNYRRYCG